MLHPFIRRGTTDIGAAASAVTVLFVVPFDDASWHFVDLPFIKNTTDGSPLLIRVATITERTASGFSALLSGETDSANYDILWACEAD